MKIKEESFMRKFAVLSVLLILISGLVACGGKGDESGQQNQDALYISAVSGKHAGDAPFNLSTTGGSGTGAVTYSQISGNDVALVSSTGLVTKKAAGDFKVKAAKAGDDDYKPVTSEETTITILPSLDPSKGTQAALYITSVIGKSVGDEIFSLSTTGGSGTGAVTYSQTSGNDVATVSLTGLVTIEAAGDFKVKATKAGDSNYNSITSAEITITVLPEIDVGGEEDANYASGRGTERTPYIISTPQQLIYFADKVNGGERYLGAYIALDADIDLGNIEWTPIGNTNTVSFLGNFDGRGHTVKNFKITVLVEFVGLFGCNSGTIKRLGVETFIITVTATSFENVARVGGLSGQNSGTIADCYALSEQGIKFTTNFTSYSPANTYAGGLIGYNTGNGMIKNSFASVYIEAAAYYKSYAGGLSGYNSGGIANCFATGNVWSKVAGAAGVSMYSACAGGIVGFNDDDKTEIMNSFRYDGQQFRIIYHVGATIYNLPTNTKGSLCTNGQLNSKTFCFTTLNWSEEIWVLETGYPYLKKI